MFRRRRKQRDSEPESFKPKGTSLDLVKNDVDELKEPKKLDEFQLVEDQNTPDDRISSQSEPRSPDRVSGKRVSPVRRPSSKSSTPTNSSKLRSPISKSTPKARKVGSHKKKTDAVPVVLKVESAETAVEVQDIDDQESTNSPVSVDAPVIEHEEETKQEIEESVDDNQDVVGNPSEDVDETGEILGDGDKVEVGEETVDNQETVEVSVNENNDSDISGDGPGTENETKVDSGDDDEGVTDNEQTGRGGGGGGAADDDGRTVDEIAHQEMLLSQDDPTHPPPRYIEGMHGDMPEATRRWANTLKWRKENNIDDVAKEPNPQYPLIRKHYSHFFHGHAKTGSVVLYIRPGKSNFPLLWKELVENTKGGAAKQRLIVPDDLVRHHIFMLEALFQHWGPVVKGRTGERPTSVEMQRLVAVFDLEGFSFRSLRSFFGVFKKVVQILEQHFVGRADRIMVINAPNFRNVAYLVYPLVPKEVKAKIEICGKRFQSRLRELLVPEEIPKEYGGDSEVPVGEFILEKHINAMYNHPDRQYPPHVPFTGEILDEAGSSKIPSDDPPVEPGANTPDPDPESDTSEGAAADVSL